MKSHIAKSTFLLLAACTLGAAPARAKDAYDIDVVIPLTGGASFLGRAQQDTLQIEEKVINNAGGINGTPVHFKFNDDQSSPQVAVQLSSRIVARHPAVLLGSSVVGMCNAIAPLMRNGPVQYCFSPGIYPKTDSYVFTASTAARDNAAAMIRYFRSRGWTHIALLTSIDATGQDAERGLNDVLAMPENKDVKVVEREHFAPADVSVSAQIERIKAAHPDALYAWSTGAPIATIFKAIAQAGLDIPIGTTNGNQIYAQMAQYKSFLPKELYIGTSAWLKDSSTKPNPAREQFFAAFAAAKERPDIAAVLAWDPVLVVIDALRKVGVKATAPQLRDAIAGMKGFDGINGTYDFTKVPQRGLGENNAIVTRWDVAKDTWVAVSGPAGNALASNAP